MKRTIDFSNYLFRCHSIGKIMVGLTSNELSEAEKRDLAYFHEKVGQGKELTSKQQERKEYLLEKKNRKPELSKGAKTFLEKLHNQEVWGRKDYLESKYTEKGIEMEDPSITLYSNIIDEFLIKNAERFNNNFLTGEPDNVQGVIRDFKNSWDLNTFPMHKKKIPTKDYWWQIQSYFDLMGKEYTEAELVYCLMDISVDEINDEIRRLDWKHKISDMDGNIAESCIPLVVEKVKNCVFTEEGLEKYLKDGFYDIDPKHFSDFVPIPDPLRVKVYKIQRDDKAIGQIHSQIELAREYLNELSLDIADRMDVKKLTEAA